MIIYIINIDLLGNWDGLTDENACENRGFLQRNVLALEQQKQMSAYKR